MDYIIQQLCALVGTIIAQRLVEILNHRLTELLPLVFST